MPSYDSIIVCIYMAKVNNNASNNAFNLSRDKRNWNYIIGILGYTMKTRKKKKCYITFLRAFQL